MKVVFNGFWEGFYDKNDPINVKFFCQLLKDVYGEDPEISYNINDADILMESVFTNTTFVNHKPWKASFYTRANRITLIVC